MEFHVLGALEVRSAGKPVRLPAGRAQIVLSTLIIHHNQVVTRERLIRNCWGDSPPATASTQIHAFVSSLRRHLGERSDTIVTVGSGYRLSAYPESVDSERARRLIARARTDRREGRHAAAADGFRDALTLWRGEAFDGLAADQLAAERAHLEQLRLAVRHEWAAELLALGQPADVVAELGPVVAEQPFDEGLRSLLMIALQRIGRRVEALATYRLLRKSLIEELGLEPGPEIQRVHQQILAEASPPTRPHRLRPVPAPVRETAVVAGVV